MTTSTNEMQWAYAKAYGKFVEACGDTAGWLINLHQRQQTIGMLASRLGDMVSFLRDLRKGKFDSTLKKLKKSRSNAPKTLADNFLELHFGWEPIVKDIGATINLLDSPFSDKPVSKSSRVKNSWKYKEGSFPAVWEASHDVTAVVKIGAKVRVTNENLYLGAKLGLTNLAAVVWDAVPFSFIADHFANIGNYLQSFSDFQGIELIDPYVTYYGTVVTDTTYQDGKDVYHPNEQVLKLRIGSRYVSLWRELGVPNLRLQLKPYNFTLTKALVYSALLVNRLPGLAHYPPRV